MPTTIDEIKIKDPLSGDLQTKEIGAKASNVLLQDGTSVQDFLDEGSPIINNKQDKALSSSLVIDGVTTTTVEDSLDKLNEKKQNAKLASNITVDGVVTTAIEDTVNALNNKKQNKALASTMVIDGFTTTTVEDSLDKLNQKKLNVSLKGQPNGLAELDKDGIVPLSQLPGTLSELEKYDTKEDFPAVGRDQALYVALDTNYTYRWTGVDYAQIDESVQLGITHETAYYGDLGKIAYDHSQTQHARVDATKVEASSTNGNIKINGAETTVYTPPGVVTTAANGLAPKVTDKTKFLKGDGTWATPDNTTYSVATLYAAGLMSTADREKLTGIAAGAEVNVQSDWNVTDASSDAFIKNKPGDATTAVKGLMTTAQVDKLNTIERNAQVNVQSDWSVTTITDKAYIKNKPGDATTAAKGLMTTAQVSKLNGIANGAEVNVQSDWSITDTNSDAFIKNKPTIPVVTGKADKVSGATADNFAGLDSNGNLKDSGKKAADFAAASHNQASSTITTMSGYSKASSAAAISTSDSLNTAIGKLEKSLDGKAPTNHASTATTYGVGNASNYGHVKVDASPTSNSSNAVQSGGVYTALSGKANTSHNQASNTITTMTGYAKASSAAAISTSDSLNTAIGKLEKTLDGKTSNTGTVTKIATGTGLTGGPVTTSGTISLASGVVTAGSAGPTAAVTGNDGATIAVPRITVDTYGRVTALTSYNLTNKNTTYSMTQYTDTPTNLAAFVQATAKGTLLSYFKFKDTNNVLTLGAQWLRGYLQYQNGYGTSYSVDGQGLITTQDNKTYLVTISGTTSFTVTKKLFRSPTGNATTAQVLSGYTFSNASSDGLSGGMANRGALTNAAVASGTFPAGYYSSNSVTKKAATTVYTSASNQSIAANQFLTGAQTILGVSMSNISAANIKKGVVVKVGDSASTGRLANVTGTFTSCAAASAITTADVLKGKIGWVNGAQINGNMTNQGAWTSTGVVCNATTTKNVTIPAGYHNGSGYVQLKSLKDQTGPKSGTTAVASAQMMSGYSGWVNGVQITGSIANKGALTVTDTSSFGTSQTVSYPAGYYSTINVTRRKSTATTTITTQVAANYTSASATLNMGNYHNYQYVNMVNVIKRGMELAKPSGGFSIVQVGTINSTSSIKISMTGYANYQNFTNDNFIVAPRNTYALRTSAPKNADTVRVDKSYVSGSGTETVNGSAENYLYTAWTYNASTGELSVSCYQHNHVAVQDSHANKAKAIPATVYLKQ